MKALRFPILVVLLILLFQWPILSGLYSFLEIGPDLTVMAVPDLELRAKALRSAVIPIWDPYQLGGESMLGVVTPGLFDPFSYPLLLMPFKHGHIPFQNIQWYFGLLHCAAGLAAYAFIRDWKLRSPIAAVVGGVFYAISGVPGNSPWIQFVTESIYPPLVLMFLFRSLRGHRPLGNAAIAGGLLGISWFSGTHHIPLIASLLCCALLLIFMFLGERWLGLLRLIIFGGMVFCFSAPQTLPALECARLSTRWVGLDKPIVGAAKVPFASHFAAGMDSSALLGMIVPLDLQFWGSGMIFAGIVALAYSILAATRIAVSRRVRVFLALVLAGILMSLPRHNIFYGITFLAVPILEKLRETTVWIFVTNIGVTGLLALGADHFFANDDIKIELRMPLVMGIVGGMLLVTSYIIQVVGRPGFQIANDRLAMSGFVALLLSALWIAYRRQVFSPAFTAACLLGLLLIEHGNVSSLGGHLYYPRGNGYASRYEEPLRATDALADFLRTRKDVIRVDVDPNDVPFNFGDLQMIEELNVHPALMLTSAFEMGIWTPRTKQLYGVNYLLARKPSQPDQVDLFTAPSGIKVFSNPNARPRVWSVHQIVKVKDYGQARAVLYSPPFDMAKTALLDEQPPSLESCESGDHLELLKRTWFSLDISANMACRGMVVLNDNWYPGWRATLDGKTVPIHPAYMSIRGVVVDAGQHTIKMRYRPSSLYWGLIFFLVGIAVTVWLIRRKEAPSDDLLPHI
jgi:hypothetical protein